MTDVVYQCPKCTSASVDSSPLVGGSAHCRVCSWDGVTEDLLVTPFEHMLGTQEGIRFELHNDLRRLLATPEVAKAFVHFLDRWGFIDLKQPKPITAPLAGRYIGVIANAIRTSIITERLKIDEESARG